ncbi:MAG: adenylosuccinate lyase [Bacillota bacterium]|nr:adenylosuccinate lyase [Bacillota bacterium]
MATSLIDSRIFRDSYGTDEMRRIWDDESTVQSWLDVEAALARAQARLGLVPEAAAQEISAKAKIENLHLDEVREGYVRTGHPIMPMIRALQRACETSAGEYIHWGATTQDIMDTGCILQTRSALEAIERSVRALEQTCVGLARLHKMTVMVGRTHGQHAVPITFGYKVAVWVEELRRHIARLTQLRPRVLAVEFSGAAGTLATIGPEMGFALQQELARELDLGVPSISWHSARDGFAELLSVLGMIMGTVAKIANEVVTLQRTEIAELEQDATGRIGSSTMPHKRNPMQLEHVVALARFVRSNADVMLEVMSGEHERDWRTWGSEMKLISESFVISAAGLAILNSELPRVKVRVDNMKRNLDTLHGLLLSERVMMRLAGAVGRQTAHEIVYEDSMEAFEEARPLKKVLEEDSRVTEVLSSQEIEDLMDPASYLGLAPLYVDRVAG